MVEPEVWHGGELRIFWLSECLCECLLLELGNADNEVCPLNAPCDDGMVR